jgi:hypothetical protein
MVMSKEESVCDNAVQGDVAFKIYGRISNCENVLWPSPMSRPESVRPVSHVGL